MSLRLQVQFGIVLGPRAQFKMPLGSSSTVQNDAECTSSAQDTIGSSQTVQDNAGPTNSAQDATGTSDRFQNYAEPRSSAQDATGTWPIQVVVWLTCLK